MVRWRLLLSPLCSNSCSNRTFKSSWLWLTSSLAVWAENKYCQFPFHYFWSRHFKTVCSFLFFIIIIIIIISIILIISVFPSLCCRRRGGKLWRVQSSGGSFEEHRGRQLLVHEQTSRWHPGKRTLCVCLCTCVRVRVLTCRKDIGWPLVHTDTKYYLEISAVFFCTSF